MSRVTRRPRAGVALLLVALVAGTYALDAQVTGDRLLRAASEPHNWLTYGGTYTSQRYSTLDQITPANVARLESKWVVQNQVVGAWQSNPLVVDGVMYLTQRPNDVMAIDAKTGSMYWLYRHTPSADAKVCCDGKTCKATDLKVGSQIRVTTQTDDKDVATKIESLDKQAKFAQSV